MTQPSGEYVKKVGFRGVLYIYISRIICCLIYQFNSDISYHPAPATPIKTTNLGLKFGCHVDKSVVDLKGSQRALGAVISW